MGGQNTFAIGMVLRNHQGLFIAEKTMRFAGPVSVLEAELTCILEALLWSQEVAEGTILIEDDSLLSVNAINRGQCNLLEIGYLVHQCDDLLRRNSRLSLSQVKKQANK